MPYKNPTQGNKRRDLAGAIATADLAAGAVTAAKIGANAVGPAALGADLATGFIPLLLSGMRLVAANDVPASGAADGGVISKNTDPILERVNGATDKRLRIKWAAASVVEIILGSFPYPPDLDPAQPVLVKVLAKMGGATDTPVLALSYFEGTGDANRGGNTAALAAAEGMRSVSVTAGGASPRSATVGCTPAAHGTDTVELYAAWIEYSRRA